jgi:hypothetical protein
MASDSISLTGCRVDLSSGLDARLVTCRVVLRELLSLDLAMLLAMDAEMRRGWLRNHAGLPPAGRLPLLRQFPAAPL